MGRKEIYNPATFPLLAEGAARSGLNDEQIAKKLGISHETFYQYQKKYPDFFEAIKRGKAPVDEEVENILLKKIKGFSYKETKIEKDEHGNVIRKTVTEKESLPDTTSMIFWLKNRKPEEWHEKKILEHTGEIKTDNNLKIEVVKVDKVEELGEGEDD